MNYTLLKVLAFTITVSQLYAAVVVTVPRCYQTGVEWVVTGGTVGGITYVETTTNTSCRFGITNSTTQDFMTNYTICGTTPAINETKTEHKMIIVVQSHELYNVENDTRWLVTCLFNVSSDTVESIFVFQSNNPSGDPNNNITTTFNPRPQLALYVDSSGSETQVNTSTILTIGTNVTARVTLDQNTTDYNLQITQGNVAAIYNSTALATVTLLNGTSYCALHPVFLSFVYLQTAEGYWYAETNFQVFLPTISSIDQATATINLRLSLTVSLCLIAGTGCSQVSCPDRTSRRRRQIEDQTPASTAADENFELSDGFQIELDGNADRQTDNNPGVVIKGTNENEDKVCLDKSEFWGLIMGLLGFLALACLASCCLMLFCVRCRRRRRRESKKLSETSSETGTLSTIMERKLTGEPVQRGSFVLPRFVPIFNTGSEKQQ